jgi:hypothetical protein
MKSNRIEKGFGIALALILILILTILIPTAYSSNFNINADRQEYSPDEEIYIFVSGPANTGFTVKIFDPEGDLVFEESGGTTGSGSGYFSCQGFSAPGEYDIILFHQGDDMAGSSFTVGEPEGEEDFCIDCEPEPTTSTTTTSTTSTTTSTTTSGTTSTATTTTATVTTTSTTGTPTTTTATTTGHQLNISQMKSGIRDGLNRQLDVDITFRKKSGKIKMNAETDSYDVEVIPKNLHVKRIEFRDLRIELDGIDLGLDEPPETGKFVEMYAIDPTKLNFSDATVTAIAKGNELYKCQEWNFYGRKCKGTWKKIMDITPGADTR